MDVGVAAAGAILAGLALAACAGFRAFLPLFALGIGAKTGMWPGDAPAYLSSDPWLLALGVATLAEILADKIPLVDHALDAIQSVVRPVAGAFLLYPGFAAILPEGYAAGLAALTGAPLAFGVHAAKASARIASTTTPGGVANPVLSLLEDLIAAALAILALLVPAFAAAAVIFLVLWLLRRARSLRRTAPRAPARS